MRRVLPVLPPGRLTRRISPVAIVLFASLLGTTHVARAAVSVFGDVTPMDNPFTTDDNEGLPSGQGNFIDNTEPLPFGDNQQITFEGWINFDFINPANDTNVNEHVFIGTRSYGLVQIGAPTEIRFMNLVVGGSTIDDDDNVFIGNGNLEISGPGALYNNDYELLPGFIRQFFPNVTGADISENPRALEPEALEGFDMIVGQGQGQGTVSILAGARAEIHDSIVLGDDSGSIGRVTVDGFGSFLGGGGFVSEMADEDDPHVTVIGRLGFGELNITTGGQMHSAGIITMEMDRAFGAILGGNPYFVIDVSGGNEEEPGLGGTGVALVDGPGSRWVIGGALQLGGYSDSENLDNTIDIEGNNVVYGSRVGDAHLTVQNNGRVFITTVPSDDAIEVQTELLIGRRGILDLDTGGRVVVGNPADQDENVILINDGVIRGNGRIDTGIFRNRHLGEVRVGPEQKLFVSAGADFAELSAPPLPEEFPLLNYGLIEVSQGEIEFDRGEDDPETDPAVFQPFRNSALDINDADQLISRRAGLIESYDSVMRFRTGISNQGIMLFSGGNNEVYGDVNNLATTVDPLDPMAGGFLEGLIQITGNETFVVFKDILTNGGTIEVGPNTLGFTAGAFNMAPTATLDLSLAGGESGQEITHISVVDTALLSGRLEIASLPAPPMAGDVFEILSAGNALFGNFTSFGLPFLGGTLGWFPHIDFATNSYLLEVLAAAPMGVPDLNGDGVVNSIDEAIWLANVGNPGGLGDINGDGVVDGQDLLIILGSLGPFPGAGGGSGGVGSTVPEPASLVLLVSMLAGPVGCARWRRRN